MIRPGFTTATHSSGFPLPLPIRVSAGFFVTGLSGKIRIQILPPRLRLRVSATRAASICRLVTQPGSSAFSPYSRSEEHTSELQSRSDLVCRLLLEKKKTEPQNSGHAQAHRRYWVNTTHHATSWASPESPPHRGGGDAELVRTAADLRALACLGAR